LNNNSLSMSIFQPGLVSIMMPAYNAEKFIASAIESVLNQTYSLWELIIINDGSSDHTADILKSYTDSRIRVFHQPNSGEAAARNNALTKINGEFLAFLDSDDQYAPTYLALMVSFLNQHPELDAVYCDGFYINSENKVLSSLSKFRRGPFVGDLFEQLVRASDVFGPPLTVMMRSSRILPLNISFDTRIVIGPDWDFFTRASQFIRYGYLDHKLCYYRIHQTNISLTAGSIKKTQSLILCRTKMLDLPRFHECSEETRYYVFYDLFVNLLHGDGNFINKLLTHPAFENLSPSYQNQLIRLAVLEGILNHLDHAPLYRKLLKNAVIKYPSDKKTRLVKFLLDINPMVLQTLLKVRQLLRSENKIYFPSGI